MDVEVDDSFCADKPQPQCMLAVKYGGKSTGGLTKASSLHVVFSLHLYLWNARRYMHGIIIVFRKHIDSTTHTYIIYT